MNEPFYIGWQDRPDPEIKRFIIRCVLLLLSVGLGFAIVLARMQRTIGVSVFEWGTEKKFSGIMKAMPYPHLIVPRPGASGAAVSFSTYYLVAPFKHGLDPASVAALDGRTVSLRGTLIYRENETMIEAIPDSIKASLPQMERPAGLENVSLGRQTFDGEILDSKCYFGVMNPGQSVPHRDCAILCISGGIPPVFLVRQKHGGPLYLLLASADNKPVNQQVLDMVAEPVEIRGEVERQGELLILRADPSTYRRLNARSP